LSRPGAHKDSPGRSHHRFTFAAASPGHLAPLVHNTPDLHQGSLLFYTCQDGASAASGGATKAAASREFYINMTRVSSRLVSAAVAAGGAVGTLMHPLHCPFFGGGISAKGLESVSSRGCLVHLTVQCLQQREEDLGMRDWGWGMG